MTQLKLIQERPNPQAITFVLEKDIMGPLSKVSISRADTALLQYSPLAQVLYQVSKMLTRVDFFIDDDKNTRISLSRPLMPWEPVNIEKTRNLLTDFAKTGQQFLLPEAIAQNLETKKAYEPEGPIQTLVAKVFRAQVNPIVEKDGGAMELTNIELRNDGSIYADVLIAGACSGCKSASSHTLQGAMNGIIDAINMKKAEHPDIPLVQSLSFKEIRSENVQRMILSR